MAKRKVVEPEVVPIARPRKWKDRDLSAFSAYLQGFVDGLRVTGTQWQRDMLARMAEEREGR